MGKDLASTKSHVGLSGKVFKRIIAGSDGRILWQAGANVTYIVDTGTSYIEEVDSGASCLSPKTFTPAKSGWTFVGWREDGQANASVLSSKVMGSDPIVLYAVYSKTITISYYQISNTTLQKTTGTQYVNAAGTWQHPKFSITPGGFGSEWTWRGWTTTPNDPDAAVSYENISNAEFTRDATIYPLIYKSVTLSYNGNGATSGSVASQSGNRYVTTSGSGNTDQPAYFTLASNGFSRTDYTFNGWDLGAVSSTISCYDNTTAYAVWKQTTVRVITGGVLQSGYTPYVTADASTLYSNSYGYGTSQVSGYYGVWFEKGIGEESGYVTLRFAVDTTNCKKMTMNLTRQDINSNGERTPYVKLYNGGTTASPGTEIFSVYHPESTVTATATGNTTIVEMSYYCEGNEINYNPYQLVYIGASNLYFTA